MRLFVPSLFVLQLLNIQWSSPTVPADGFVGFCHGFVVVPTTPHATSRLQRQVIVLSLTTKTDNDDNDIDIVEIRADIERLREDASHRLDALSERFKEVDISAATAATTVPSTKMEESLTEIANEFDRDMKELSNSNMGFSEKKEVKTSDIDIDIDDNSSSSLKPHHRHKTTVDELYPKKVSATKKTTHKVTVDELYPKKEVSAAATKKTAAHKTTVDELYPKKEVSVTKKKKKTAVTKSTKDQKKDTLKLLDDTRWKMMLNIGRVPGTWMPKTWGASGDTLKLKLEIEFTSIELYERENFLSKNGISKILRIVGEEGQTTPTMAEGSSKVRITNGGWKILQQDGPFQTSVLRFYFNVEEQEVVGHTGSDVYLPKGRIYGTCGYFPMTTRSNVDGNGTSKRDAYTNELRQLEVKYESLKDEKDNTENDDENDHFHHRHDWWLSNNIIRSSFHKIQLLHEMMVVREDAVRLQQYIENEKIREPSKDKLRLSQDQLVGLTKGKMFMVQSYLQTQQQQ
jgi:hypothetical protein